MIAYTTNELVPSSELSKKFGAYLKKIKDKRVEKIAILKNNKIEAVILSKDEYEKMRERLKEIEAKEILSSIENGLKDVKDGKTHSIDTLWDEIWK